MRLAVNHTTGPIAPGRGERLTPGRGDGHDAYTPSRGERKIMITLCTVGTLCILFRITLSVDDILYSSIYSLNSMQESRSIYYHLPLTHQIFYFPTDQWYYSLDEPRLRMYTDEPRPREYADEPRAMDLERRRCMCTTPSGCLALNWLALSPQSF